MHIAFPSWSWVWNRKNVLSRKRDGIMKEGFPGSSAGKEFTCKAGDPGLISGSGRSAGEGIDYPLQYSWASLVRDRKRLEVRAHRKMSHSSLETRLTQCVCRWGEQIMRPWGTLKSIPNTPNQWPTPVPSAWSIKLKFLSSYNLAPLDNASA